VECILENIISKIRYFDFLASDNFFSFAFLLGKEQKNGVFIKKSCFAILSLFIRMQKAFPFIQRERGTDHYERKSFKRIPQQPMLSIPLADAVSCQKAFK